MSISPGLSKLSKPDKPQFVSLMSGAFSRDPLFLHLFGDCELELKAGSSVTAFVSFMFDKSCLLHEEAWGLFDNGVLQGAYVVEKPHTNLFQSVRGGVLLIGRLLPCIACSIHKEGDGNVSSRLSFRYSVYPAFRQKRIKHRHPLRNALLSPEH